MCKIICSVAHQVKLSFPTDPLRTVHPPRKPWAMTDVMYTRVRVTLKRVRQAKWLMHLLFLLDTKKVTCYSAAKNTHVSNWQTRRS